MENFYIFVKALDFIEIHLCDDMTQDEIAAHCRCSVSTLQKIWKFCTHQGIMHYIKRRRLTLAARELQSGAPVLTTAVRYGYGSNAAFTRAIGDEVIKACVRRIDAALKPDMLAFRIGGDEFAVVTGTDDITIAQQMEQAVTAGNDEIVTLGEDTAIAYLHSGIMKFEDTEGDFYERFEAAVVRKM